MRSSVISAVELEFGFQQIVANGADNQDWVEMLFRPDPRHLCKGVESFFESLSISEQVKFDTQALEYACSRITSGACNRRTSINISPKSLNDKLFLQRFNNLLNEKKLNPNKICIEVVETSGLNKMSEYCKFTLSNFRGLGGWLALDDFGTGFAHWELLKLDLVDVIKVVNNNINKNQASNVFLAAMSNFAKNQKIISVLEGIETEDDLSKGIELGFNYFQGYLFS